MSIHQKTKSLAARGSELADTFIQLEVLNGHKLQASTVPSFEEKLHTLGFAPLRPSGIEIFQMNIGKLCNQTCAHCHVDAGPDRKHELMSLENLDLPDFFAAHQVNVVSSLPYFTKLRTDAQRGDGVFEDSIKALQMLNAAGYGQEGGPLQLDLVYNPSGAFLPGAQATLELEFKRHLKQRYDIVFNNLFTITNLPVSRFLEYLLQSGNYESYMQNLVEAFNPGTVPGLMCRNTISVSWEGFLYDCDFNQMLDLHVAPAHCRHLNDFDLEALNSRSIVLNQHCYGCTAGAGSSCGGAIEG